MASVDILESLFKTVRTWSSYNGEEVFTQQETTETERERERERKRERERERERDGLKY